MKLDYTKTALRALDKAPAPIRKAFYKQAGFLLQDLHHPSLHAKKYSESEDKWQARVTRAWRFYFKIIGDTYLIEGIRPHPRSKSRRAPRSAMTAGTIPWRSMRVERVVY
jgi:mRNA-degrading endonuclease RelE of RelBE toxin-antitoxin system